MSFELLGCAFGISRAMSVVTVSSGQQNGPYRPADERGRGTTCWFRSGRTRGHPAFGAPDALCARYRAHPHDSRTTFAPPYLIRLSAKRPDSLHRPERRYSFRSQS